MKNKRVKFQHLGTAEYEQVWVYQEKLFQTIIDQKVANRTLPLEHQLPTDNYLLFVHHPSVYTLGKSGDLQHLLLSDEELKELNIKFYHINRGGDITYHGPGQIVGYPILDLDNFFTDIHAYLRLLEEAVIQTCQDFGVFCGRIQGLTGVWVNHHQPLEARKICALGVKSSRWVTMHGFAFNVNTDLNYFKHIVPCGIDDKEVTSLKVELGHEVEISIVENTLVEHLARLFEFQIIHS